MLAGKGLLSVQKVVEGQSGLLVSLITETLKSYSIKSNTIKNTEMLMGYDKAFIRKVAKKATKKCPIERTGQESRHTLK